MTNLTSIFCILFAPFFMIDFDSNTSTDNWYIVNDGVMGGVSSSNFEINDAGHGHFTGDVSLENNGGFASVRCRLKESPKTGKKQVHLRVKGDGQTYQFRIRTDKGFDGLSYRHSFEAIGEWQELHLELSDFEPSFRGRILSGQPKLQSEDIQQLGFLIADKQAGAFELQIDWIKLEN